VNDTPKSDEDELGRHVIEAHMVHEAAHYLDFIRTGHRFQPFDLDHFDALPRIYYNKLHEFSAFFYQGLYCFRRDIRAIPNQARSGAREALKKSGSQARPFKRCLLADRFCKWASRKISP
jgi:hypothetical protein